MRDPLLQANRAAFPLESIADALLPSVVLFCMIPVQVFPHIVQDIEVPHALHAVA